MKHLATEPKPAALPVEIAAIPIALTRLNHWVLWRWAVRAGKWTKPPLMVNGEFASSTDATTWTTFEAVCTAYRDGGFDGIGFVPTVAVQIVGGDLDDALDVVTGLMHPEALAIVRAVDSYTERSPSGAGFRFFAAGTWPNQWKNERKALPFPIEVYSQERYLTVTGQHLAGTPTTVEARSDALANLHARVLALTGGRNGHAAVPAHLQGYARGTGTEGVPVDAPLTDAEVLLKARTVMNAEKFTTLFDRGDWRVLAYLSQSEADQALCSLLAFWTQDEAQLDRLFRQSKLFRKKWDERRGPTTYGARTIAKALIREEIYTGTGASPIITISDDTESSPTPSLCVPADALLGLGRDFAELYQDYCEAPFEFLYFSFQTYFGALIAKRVTSDSVLNVEPRLYTVCIGESGATRKSTALRLTDEFFSSLPLEIPGLSPTVAAERGSPVPCLFGVGSAEGLAAELGESSSLLLHFDELKHFVDKASSEGSALLPMVATLFERGSYDNRTKTGKVSIRGAALSLLAACTTETYGNLFTKDAFDVGLLNRLWLVTGTSTRSFALPPAMDEAKVDALRTKVAAALNQITARWLSSSFLGKPLRYKVTAEAAAVFKAWYQARTGATFERRLDTYGHRLMLLLAASLGRTEVDVEVAEAVVSLLAYQLRARRALEPVDAEGPVPQMEEKIRRVPTGMTKRDLQRAVNYHRAGIWVFNQALDNLLKNQEVQFRDGRLWLT